VKYYLENHISTRQGTVQQNYKNLGAACSIDTLNRIIEAVIKYPYSSEQWKVQSHEPCILCQQVRTVLLDSSIHHAQVILRAL